MNRFQRIFSYSVVTGSSKLFTYITTLKLQVLIWPAVFYYLMHFFLNNIILHHIFFNILIICV
jgi:hypothetical protein